VAGVDEAGRGPLAGLCGGGGDPASAAAHSGTCGLQGASAQERARLAPIIRARALAWAIGWADRDEIDCLNILEATLLAMRRALLALPCVRRTCRSTATAVRASPTCLSCTLEASWRGMRAGAISAASILAKVYRDRMMEQSSLLSGFELARTKGYGTPHLTRISLNTCDRGTPSPGSKPR